MSKPLKIIGVIVIVLLILAGVYYFFFFKQEKEKSTESVLSEQENQFPAGPNQPKETGQIITPTGPIVKKEQAVTSFAASFAARLGSYSNQSNYANIEDLKPLMTAKMKNWAEKYVADQKSENTDTSSYSGTTTKSLSTNIISQSDTAAEIEVSTQKIEKAEGQTDKVYYQKITLKLVRENDVWKVDSAEWKK